MSDMHEEIATIKALMVEAKRKMDVVAYLDLDERLQELTKRNEQ